MNKKWKVSWDNSSQVFDDWVNAAAFAKWKLESGYSEVVLSIA
jgi:hypothetical protein